MISFRQLELQVARAVTVDGTHVGCIWTNKAAKYKFVPKDDDPETSDGYWWPMLQYAQHTAAITPTNVDDRCYGSFTEVMARWRSCAKRAGKRKTA